MTSHASVQGKKRTMYYERAKPNPVNYANNCTGKPNWQKHHILPCTSVKRSIKAAGIANLDKALKYFTVWNINDAPNLMPLPTRAAYQKLYGKKGGKQGVTGTLGNLPCHQPTSWGHQDYNEAIQKALLKVWANVTITIKNHKLDANDIASDITSLKNTWEGKVNNGPPTRVGTQANWRAMMQGQAGAHNHFTMVKMASSPV